MVVGPKCFSKYDFLEPKGKFRHRLGFHLSARFGTGSLELGVGLWIGRERFGTSVKLFSKQEF